MSHLKVHDRTMSTSNDSTSIVKGMSSRFRKLATAGVGLSAAALLAGCATDAPQYTWKPAGAMLRRSKTSNGRYS